MSPRTTLRALSLVGLSTLCVQLGHASPTTYTNVSDFDAAVASGFQPLNDINFDAMASGALIPSGTTLQGVTFTYLLGGGAFEMQVGSTFDTTSPPNYLGTTGDDAFLSGDSFTMTFASPEQAVGLFVISGGIDYAGDYTLSTPDGAVSNSDSTDSTYGTLGDGGAVYFMGLVETDPSKAFTSATFSSLANLGIPFNIDDIVTTTSSTVVTPPVPDATSTLALLSGACACLLPLRRRRA
jgi:hypothetical protein